MPYAVCRCMTPASGTATHATPESREPYSPPRVVSPSTRRNVSPDVSPPSPPPPPYKQHSAHPLPSCNLTHIPTKPFYLIAADPASIHVQIDGRHARRRARRGRRSAHRHQCREGSPQAVLLSSASAYGEPEPPLLAIRPEIVSGMFNAMLLHVNH